MPPKRGRPDSKRSATWSLKCDPNLLKPFRVAWTFQVSHEKCNYFQIVENGRASNLMKSSTKRKRTREELEEVKQEEEELKNDK
jgi:hypothetical protein